MWLRRGVGSVTRLPCHHIRGRAIVDVASTSYPHFIFTCTNRNMPHHPWHGLNKYFDVHIFATWHDMIRTRH